jgi:two-component system sensor histidine kinase BaeS
MYGFMQWSSDQGLLIFINKRDVEKQEKMAHVLATYYDKYQSWTFLKNNHQLWHQLNRSVDQAAEQNAFTKPSDKASSFERPSPKLKQPNFGGRPPPSEQRQNLPSRIIFLNERKQTIFGHLKDDENYAYVPIIYQDKEVGWLTAPPYKEITDDFNLSFVEAQNKHFLMVCGLLIILSACVSLPLSARLVRPVKALVKASHKLSSGDFSVRIKDARNDELGHLIKDFNSLAATLEANESARRRWVGDVSHELRTPLTIMRGELEAMIDSVRPLSRDGVESAHQEVLHLQRLVEDLYELTNADIGALSYRKEELNLLGSVAFAESQFKSACQEKNIKLKCEYIDSGQEGIYIYADKSRMLQLLHNLIQNSIKYTDSEGEIRLTTSIVKGQAVLIVEDSLPGVSSEELSLLFDYLYRTDKSRSRMSGGVGLGLAICQRIVEGHDGSIHACHSELGGLKISIHLPLS